MKQEQLYNKPHVGIVMVIVIFLFSTTILIERCYGETQKIPSLENLARLATVSGSGQGFPAAVDGVKQKDGAGEWIGGSPNRWYGWIDYPKLELKWEKPQKINKVVIYDRPTLNEHMAACILKFSDGSEEHLFAVPNDGSAKTLVFEPREVTGMELNVVDGIGTQIGLAEVEVYYDPAARPTEKRNKKYTDFGLFTDVRFLEGPKKIL